jgi:RimJ/RimL family protein N-acetyltransferase
VLGLRPTTAADLETLYEFQADPPAAEMAGFPSRDHATYFAHWSGVLADPAVAKSTIVVDGEVVGSLVCFGPPEAREVGYWVGRAYWGRQFASRALALFLVDVQERPLRAFVVPANVGSQRVLVKCGFVPDGADGDHLVFLLA